MCFPILCGRKPSLLVYAALDFSFLSLYRYPALEIHYTWITDLLNSCPINNSGKIIDGNNENSINYLRNSELKYNNI